LHRFDHSRGVPSFDTAYRGRPPPREGLESLPTAYPLPYSTRDEKSSSSPASSIAVSAITTRPPSTTNCAPHCKTDNTSSPTPASRISNRCSLMSARRKHSKASTLWHRCPTPKSHRPFSVPCESRILTHAQVVPVLDARHKSERTLLTTKHPHSVPSSKTVIALTSAQAILPTASFAILTPSNPQPAPFPSNLCIHSIQHAVSAVER